VAFTDPWSRGDFEDCLAVGVQILVAEGDSGVLGYIVGRAVRDQSEILNLGVTLNARRRGVGTSLVRHLLASFAAAGVREVFLEVRESNLAAQGLYRAFGFQDVGRRRRYYRRPVEDAVILRAAIPAAEPTA
jgi:ribosomal-protein-alanine N-acetyltransferase